MRKISRREFLLSAATGLGAVALQPLLTGCNPAASDIPAEGASPATNTPSANQTKPQNQATGQPTTDETAAENTPQAKNTPSTAKGQPDLVVARGGEPEDLVRQALKALGGMERFVQPGQSVLIKPNICVAYHPYEYAATTNPWVVAGLVKLALEAGAASVRVVDYPFGGTFEEAYAVSGIEEQVKAAGGEMVAISPLKFKLVDLPNASLLKSTKMIEDCYTADVFINVPIAKHHSLTRLTLGMKNLMGTVGAREVLHYQIEKNLVDLASFIQPDLTVIDAVRILKDHGPTGGNLNDVQKLDTLIASPDIVAADSYGTTLFGLQPEDIKYIQAGVKAGLGRSDLKNLKIEEIAVGA